MQRGLRTLLLLLFAVGSARGEKPPEPATLFARYVEATGGRAAWEAVENRVIEASLEVPGEGVKVTMTSYVAQPNLSYSVLYSVSSGKVEKGTDGNIVWEMSAHSVPILKQGRVRDDFLRESTLNKYLDWQEHFERAELTGTEEVDGNPAWKLVLTPPGAAEQILYFDQRSSLLVRIDLLTEGLGGDLPMEMYLRDYREAGGVLMPYQLLLRAAGQERLVTTESIETNVELPPDRFEPPDEVLALASD